MQENREGSSASTLPQHGIDCRTKSLKQHAAMLRRLARLLDEAVDNLVDKLWETG
jgi:hypothetical protein